jgi:hypothetical protein
MKQMRHTRERVDALTPSMIKEFIATGKCNRPFAVLDELANTNDLDARGTAFVLVLMEEWCDATQSTSGLPLCGSNRYAKCSRARPWERMEIQNLSCRR